MFSAAAFLLQADFHPSTANPGEASAFRSVLRRFSPYSFMRFRVSIKSPANGLTALFHPPPAARSSAAWHSHRDREAPPPALRRAQHSAALWRIRFRSRPRIPSRSSAPKRGERPAALRWKTGPSRPPSAQAPTDCHSRRNSNPSAEGIRNRSRALSARRRPLRTHAPAFHTRWGPKRPANRTERQTIRADGTQSGGVTPKRSSSVRRSPARNEKRSSPDGASPFTVRFSAKEGARTTSVKGRSVQPCTQGGFQTDSPSPVQYGCRRRSAPKARGQR